VTSRGPWYHVSWKGSEEKSGGIATNIGVHFFDLLIWLFGAPARSTVAARESARMAGTLELQRADVTWLLSTDRADLPAASREKGASTYRLITIDDEPVEFSEGFTDLHTEIYRRTLAGDGFGIDDARPAIELVSSIRQSGLAS